MTNDVSRILHMVGTDCANGDHARFERWYGDHIVQLMKFPGMQAATRFRRAVPHPTMPEYLCLYEFGSMEEFQRYNESEAFQVAEKERLDGWGKDGVSNRLRLQYERIGRWSR